MILKVAIIGPESTGKSTLSEQLAAHYQTLWVPEYAREYLGRHGTAYTYDSLLEIAKGQVAMEDENINKVLQPQTSNLKPQTPGKPSAPKLFIDTEMYVIKVWCEFVFGKCHQWVIDRIVERKYDLYLLCNVDLPWTYDVLREYPDTEPRQRLFRMYHDIVINQKTPWVIISGDYEQRLSTAINAVDGLLR